MAPVASVAAVRDRLGDILIRKGRIDLHRLLTALTEAKEKNVRLGDYLVEAGELYEEDVAVALAEQHELRYVLVDSRDANPAARGAPPGGGGAAPERTAALGDRPERVRVAISDPTDVLAIDELRLTIPGAVDLVVAEPSVIRAALDVLYSLGLRHP